MFKCPFKYVKAVRYGTVIGSDYLKHPWPVDAWQEWYSRDRRNGEKP